MLKWSFLSLVVAVFAACSVYAVKDEVQALENDLSRVARAIDQERLEITRLKAEWATLSDPARLTRLARAHSTLQEPSPRQIASIDDIPMRRDVDQDEAPALVSSMAPSMTPPDGSFSQ